MLAQEKLEKYVELGQLLSYYSKLLPEQMRNTLELYLSNNLSLSEIAELQGRSRQAVHAHVKQGCSKLYGYDLKLGLLQKAEIYLDVERELIQRIKSGKEDEALALLGLLRSLFALEGDENVR